MAKKRRKIGGADADDDLTQSLGGPEDEEDDDMGTDDDPEPEGDEEVGEEDEEEDTDTAAQQQTLEQMNAEDRRANLVSGLVAHGFSQEEANAIADRKTSAASDASAPSPLAQELAAAVSPGTVTGGDEIADKLDCGPDVWSFERHFYGPGVVTVAQDGTPIPKRAVDSIGKQKSKLDKRREQQRAADEKRRQEALAVESA